MLGNIPPPPTTTPQFSNALCRAGIPCAPRPPDIRPAGRFRADTAGLYRGGTTRLFQNRWASEVVAHLASDNHAARNGRLRKFDSLTTNLSVGRERLVKRGVGKKLPAAGSGRSDRARSGRQLERRERPRTRGTASGGGGRESRAGSEGTSECDPRVRRTSGRAPGPEREPT